MSGDGDLARPVSDTPEAAGKASRFVATVTHWFAELDTLVKVAAALTTIIGVGTAAFQGYSVWQDRAVRHHAIANYVSEAGSHLKGQDYALSWDANARALQLAPDDPAIRAQQTRIAMAWLENVRLSSKTGAKEFGDIANPLLDALVQRAASPGNDRVELANIRAHIGWARFLRSRDGVGGLRIAEEFDDALKIDPDNMYGHVMKGFYILWEGGTPEAARADFDAALNSDVDPPYRDGMILVALFNSHSDEYQVAALEYANRIRKSGRPIDADQRGRLLWFYEVGIGDLEYLNRTARAIPSAEDIATLDWLATDQTEDHRQRIDIVLKAYFLEVAGNKPDALALYQRVLAAASPETSSRILAMARSGIRRVSPASAAAPAAGCPKGNAKPKRTQNPPGGAPGCPTTH